MGPGNAGAQAKKKFIDAPRYDFVVQFCWQVPKPDTMVELTSIYPGNGVPASQAPTDEPQEGDAAARGETANSNDDKPAAPPANGATNGAAGPQPEAGNAAPSSNTAPTNNAPAAGDTK
jgi:hypothetical protein